MSRPFAALGEAAARLVRRPALSMAVVLCLGLGIGAVTAAFSLLRAVLLRELPFPESGRLVMLRSANLPRGRPSERVSPDDYRDLVEQCRSFVGIAAYRLRRIDFASADGFERHYGLYVSDNFLDVLGVPPWLGGGFSESDGGGPRRIVLGHRLWRQQLSGAPNALGQPLEIYSWESWPNGGPLAYTLVGVLPPDLRCLPAREFFLPEGVGPDDQLAFCTPMEADRGVDRRWRDLEVVARLKPGISVEAAQSELDVIARRLQAEFPDTNRDWVLRAVPLREHLYGDVRPTLWRLTAASTLVLLLAVGTAAQLLIWKSNQRQSQLAVRAAVGATPVSLAREELLEAALLGLAAGAVGLLLTRWSIDALEGVLRTRTAAELVEIDAVLLAGCALVTLIVTSLVAIIPARKAASPELTRLLNASGPTLAGGRRQRQLASAMIFVQSAGTAVLLAAAATVVDRVVRLAAVDPGFAVENRLAVSLSLPQGKHEWNYNSVFCNRVLERVGGLPGVHCAAAVEGLPTSGTQFDCTLSIEGQPWVGTGELPPAAIRVVTDDYFRTMGIPLVAGRRFAASDSIGRIGQNRTAIINRTMAERCWPGDEAVGKRFKIHPSLPWLEVVGVVGDVNHSGLEHQATSDIYYPEKLFPQAHIKLVVHTAADPLGVAPSIRREVLAIDGDAFVTNVESLEQAVFDARRTLWCETVLTASLAGVALLAAVLGLGCLTMQVADARRAEIGLRMAVGAEPGSIRRLLLRQTLVPTAIGLVAGLAVTGLAGLSPVASDAPARDGWPAMPLLAVAALEITSAALAGAVVAARIASREPAVAMRG